MSEFEAWLGILCCILGEGVKMGTDIEWLRNPAHSIQGHIEVFLINHVMLTKETSD